MTDYLVYRLSKGSKKNIHGIFISAPKYLPFFEVETLVKHLEPKPADKENISLVLKSDLPLLPGYTHNMRFCSLCDATNKYLLLASPTTPQKEIKKAKQYLKDEFNAESIEVTRFIVEKSWYPSLPLTLLEDQSL